MICIIYPFYALLHLVCGFLNFSGSFIAICVLLEQTSMNWIIVVRRVDKSRFSVNGYLIMDGPFELYNHVK